MIDMDDKGLLELKKVIDKLDEQRHKQLAKCEVVIENGVAHFIDKKGQCRMFMPEEDYEAIVAYNAAQKENKQ